MTITGQSTLDKSVIDQMVKDAEQHAEEDRQRREEAEVRNQAESLVYQTEKFLKDNDEKLPAEVKSDVQSALTGAQESLKGTDTAAIKSAMERLATESQKMGSALYQQPGADGAPGQPGADQQAQDQGDDVVDAEIVDEEKDRK